MVRYRKRLLVSSIGLAAIVGALFSQQLAEWSTGQNQPVYAIFGLERTDENLLSSQDIPLGNDNQEVQSTVDDQLVAGYSREVTTTSENITLTGWVGTEFGESFAGETVILYSPSQQIQYSTISGTSGEFNFTDLKPGWDYVLKVSPKGMFKRYTKAQIKLRSDQEVHNIVLESIPVGVLTGRIVDSYDRPSIGIELFIKTVEKDYWTTSVITDVNGSFSVAEFPKGRFQVATKGRQTLRATGLKFDPDAGVPIKLTIDLGPYDLRGRIYDESGLTFDGAVVYLNWVLNDNGVRIHSARKVNADTSGEFHFSGLGPGDHELMVSAWKGNTFNKQTFKRAVNVGVDSGELIIVINTLALPEN